MFGIIKSLLGGGNGAMTPAQAAERVRAGAIVVDVREPAEFAQGSIAGAVNIPLQTILNDGVAALERAGVAHATADLLIVCRSGMRSNNACSRLRATLGDRAVNLSGGLTAWKDAGLPMTSGK